MCDSAQRCDATTGLSSIKSNQLVFDPDNLTKKMWALIIFVLSCSDLIFADDISVSKFKFTGYRNVWHEGTDHQVRKFKMNC